MPQLLELQNVTRVFTGGSLLKKRPPVVALDQVTFTVGDDGASITAIAGESGSGKTTLANLLLGQLSPTTGHVLYRGKELSRLSAEERTQFRREVQPIFQDPFAAFNPFYRVDHVLNQPIRRFHLADNRRTGRRLIDEALEMVGLRPQETLGRFPHQLSGGQRQRIMVARALLCRPRVILADEPVSMVDASLRATILASLQQLNREFGICVIYITHDLTTAYQISDDIIILYRGSVVEAGSVEQVVQQPRHPYTRLLISSIPVPDRSKRWVAEDPQEDAVVPWRDGGCKFAARCPAVMDRCWEEPPRLYRTDQHRVAACYLYAESPEFESTDVGQIYA